MNLDAPTGVGPDRIVGVYLAAGRQLGFAAVGVLDVYGADRRRDFADGLALGLHQLGC